MCYNCGCGIADDNMGYGDLGKGGGGLVEADFDQMAKITGDSVEKTKEEILKMLQKQLNKE